jgi:hypothetical protein
MNEYYRNGRTTYSRSRLSSAISIWRPITIIHPIGCVSDPISPSHTLKSESPQQLNVFCEADSLMLVK